MIQSLLATLAMLAAESGITGTLVTAWIAIQATVSKTIRRLRYQARHARTS